MSCRIKTMAGWLLAGAWMTASVFTAQAQALLIYAAPDGVWSANGSSASNPVPGLARAFELIEQHRRSTDATATPSYRILLRGGLYPQEEALVLSADQASHVTIEAYPDETPILSGGTRLPNDWRIEEINGRTVWTQVIPEVEAGAWYFRQLWVDGQRATVPVLPKNGGFLQIQDILIEAGNRDKPNAWRHSARDAFIYAEGDFDPEWHALEDIWVMASYSWFHSYFTIKHLDADSRVVRFHQETASRPLLVAHPLHGRYAGEDTDEKRDPETFYEPAHYRIHNVREALSEPGEFYLDRQTGRLTYIPRPGEDPATAEVIAPRLNQLLAVKGTPNNPVREFWIKGVTFSHTLIRPEKYFGTGNNWGGADKEAAVRLESVYTGGILDGGFRHLGGYALELLHGTRDMDVVGNVFEDLGCGAIQTHGAFGDSLAFVAIRPDTTMRLRITDNVIRQGGRFFPGMTVMNINKARNSVIAYNEISDFFFTGIHLGGRFGRDLDFSIVDNQVLHNHVHSLGQGHWTGNDMAGIYVNGVGLGVDIIGNVVHDITCTIYGGSGIYLDQEPCYFSMRNNLIYRCTTDGFHLKGFMNEVENNIVYDTGNALGQVQPRKWPQALAQVRRNIFAPSSSVIFLTTFDVPPEDLHIESRDNLLWSLNAADNIEVAQKGGFGRRYGARMEFSEWRTLTGADQGSVIAPVHFQDPSAGDFTLTKETAQAARALGFVPFAVQAGPRPSAQRTSVPFKPDNAALQTRTFHQHVEMILQERHAEQQK